MSIIFFAEGLHRKISHDIMEVWKRNIRPLYDKEMEEISKAGKDAGRTSFEDRSGIQRGFSSFMQNVLSNVLPLLTPYNKVYPLIWTEYLD